MIVVIEFFGNNADLIFLLHFLPIDFIECTYALTPAGQ